MAVEAPAAPARLERVDFHWPAELPGVGVLVAEDCARRWVVAHTTYSICTGLALNRPARWRYRRGTYEQTADGLMLMEPGEVHANTEQTDVARFRVLFLEPALVATAAQELDASAPPHFRLAQTDAHGHPELRQVLLSLHRSLESEATALERQTRLANVLRMLLEQAAEGRPRERPAGKAPAQVERARDYIEAHLGDAITLDQLTAAARAGSRFQLTRAFAARLGLPPHAYQISRRIARARRMLEAGQRPAAVASELGFADQSHFARYFGRALGVTPGAYARAARTF